MTLGAQAHHAVVDSIRMDNYYVQLQALLDGSGGKFRMGRHRFVGYTIVALLLITLGTACIRQDETAATVEPSVTSTVPVSNEDQDTTSTPTLVVNSFRTEPIFQGDPYRSPNPALVRDYDTGSNGYIFQEVYNDLDPAWSPDGQWLAFTSTRDGDADIYVIQLDGSGLRNLSPDPSPVLATLLFLLEKSVERWPDWDPSGDYIYFTSSRTNIMLLTTRMEIYRMNADGSEVIQITDMGATGAFPAISPDGGQILFGSLDEGAVDIFSMTTDGSELNKLTGVRENNGMPDWSPAGDRILFQADLGENTDIYLMDPDGSNLIRLTDDPAVDSQPVWSPDGTRIAFVSDRDGDGELYLMDANGENLFQLTDNEVEDAEPDWSPDGTMIVYTSDTPDGRRIFTIGIEDEQINQITGRPISQPPEENAVYHLHHGLALYLQAIKETGDFASAIEAFDQAIAMDPSLGEAYLGRGMATLMRCDIYWMHVAGPVINITNENNLCRTQQAAISDIEQALELGLAPALILGTELLIELLH